MLHNENFNIWHRVKGFGQDKRMGEEIVDKLYQHGCRKVNGTGINLRPDNELSANFPPSFNWIMVK